MGEAVAGVTPSRSCPLRKGEYPGGAKTTGTFFVHCCTGQGNGRGHRCTRRERSEMGQGGVLLTSRSQKREPDSCRSYLLSWRVIWHSWEGKTVGFEQGWRVNVLNGGEVAAGLTTSREEEGDVRVGIGRSKFSAWSTGCMATYEAKLAQLVGERRPCCRRKRKGQTSRSAMQSYHKRLICRRFKGTGRGERDWTGHPREQQRRQITSTNTVGESTSRPKGTSRDHLVPGKGGRLSFEGGKKPWTESVRRREKRVFRADRFWGGEGGQDVFVPPAAWYLSKGVGDRPLVRENAW